MNIGSVVLDSPTVLAPLAGITNLAFRLLVKGLGCGLVCSEMVSANALVRRSAKTMAMLASDPAEKPVSFQIFGADPAVMAEAARIVAGAGADLIDLNLGCSVKKVVRTGAGAALMRDPQRAAAVFAAVRRAVAIPLTIKIRSGWDHSGDQALQIARLAQDCGVDAISVHPRSASQGFAGRADWSVIAAVKKTVGIPVIGNGDICGPEDALAMRAQTGCDGLMVGRAAIANPWLPGRIDAALKGLDLGDPDLDQRRRLILAYVADMVRCGGEKSACLMLRSRLGWFVKGLADASRFRNAIRQLGSQAEAVDRIEAYFDDLARLADRPA